MDDGAVSPGRMALRTMRSRPGYIATPESAPNNSRAKPTPVQPARKFTAGFWNRISGWEIGPCQRRVRTPHRIRSRGTAENRLEQHADSTGMEIDRKSALGAAAAHW